MLQTLVNASRRASANSSAGILRSIVGSSGMAKPGKYGLTAMGIGATVGGLSSLGSNDSFLGNAFKGAASFGALGYGAALGMKSLVGAGANFASMQARSGIRPTWGAASALFGAKLKSNIGRTYSSARQFGSAGISKASTLLRSNNSV